jgi:hypothetical protein
MAQWWSDHLDMLRKGTQVVPIKLGKPCSKKKTATHLRSASD